MKSKADVERRLRSLRVKYAKKYVAKTQERAHRNCVYNHEHVPVGRPAQKDGPDGKLVPRRQVTLMVLQPDQSVRLCMYGCGDTANWPGDVCDSDDVSRSCPKFKPRQSMESAKAEFMEHLKDDEWVFEHHKDLAAFQWVLEDRLHRMQLSWLERLMLWFYAVLFRRAKPSPQLPAPPIPQDLWSDDAPPPPSP